MRTDLQKRILCLLTVAALALSPVLASPQGKPEPSLYKRVGGYDAIAAVVDDFVPRLANDPQLGKFFTGHSIETKKRLRQLVVNLICDASGGPCFYTGRPMKTAHLGLGITEAEWQIAIKHLNATLDKFKMHEKEKKELIAIATGLKGDIITPTEGTGMNK